MPYRHAWLFIVALIAATVFAFWRTYFGMLSSAPAGFHVHGITATLWMLLVLAQSWTPHHRQMAVHRFLGKTTFVAGPLFAAGAMGVIHSMAVGTAAGDPFYALWGVKLGLLDALALAAVLYAIAMALCHRRNMRLHGGYMLSTALPLVSPVLGRVFNRTVPGLTIRGPQDFAVFGGGVQLANLAAGLLALWLWRRDPTNGRPWAVALAVVAVQIVGFAAMPANGTARTIFEALVQLPLSLLLMIGLAAGAAAVAVGWRAAPVRKAELANA
jgi:hypothetical protein